MLTALCVLWVALQELEEAEGDCSRVPAATTTRRILAFAVVGAVALFYHCGNSLMAGYVARQKLRAAALEHGEDIWQSFIRNNL